ncbi:hypothetical protein [Salinibaculum rarum]|uniref:hypothetical protein n=1 Tax=Salinibaculum rarum TaxID=3058903 RepID=UPI00265DB4D1|nr:hypothetical protein [Salinibaculum sp. KK48]
MQHASAAVASAAVKLALRGEPFQVSDLQHELTDPPSRQTIYRVLRQLEADDWVRSDHNTWRPDIQAEMLGDIDPNPDRGRDKGMSFDAEELLGE